MESVSQEYIQKKVVIPSTQPEHPELQALLNPSSPANPSIHAYTVVQPNLGNTTILRLQLLGPQSCCCPISGKLMTDPVLVWSNREGEEAITYDNKSIKQYLEKHKQSPTGTDLAQVKLIPNDALRETINSMGSIWVFPEPARSISSESIKLTEKKIHLHDPELAGVWWQWSAQGDYVVCSSNGITKLNLKTGEKQWYNISGDVLAIDPDGKTVVVDGDFDEGERRVFEYTFSDSTRRLIYQDKESPYHQALYDPKEKRVFLVADAPPAYSRSTSSVCMGIGVWAYNEKIVAHQLRGHPVGGFTGFNCAYLMQGGQNILTVAQNVRKIGQDPDHFYLSSCGVHVHGCSAPLGAGAANLPACSRRP